MCGPCSDGTYWSGKNEDEYHLDLDEPSKKRCPACNSPINWCHCILSLERLEKDERKGSN
jgi:hypothetical protein